MNMRSIWMTAVLSAATASFATAQSNLSVYGFFDLEFEANNQNPDELDYAFDQHHFNVITMYRINDRWRVFAEIEWEHGPGLEGGEGYGAIALERGWAEYAPRDELKIKAGKFLPPFGIYNLLHDASPSFLSTFLPSAIYGKHANTTGGSQRLFAKFGTGVQILGTFSQRGWQATYYGYVTNGRGPHPAEENDNNNSGVGGRFMVSDLGEHARFGMSYYQDRNGDEGDTKQRALAADVGIGGSGFWLESEAIIPSLETIDGGGAPNGTMRTGLGYYVQGSYRTGVGVTPFARYDFFDPDNDVDNDGDHDVVLGLNIAATPFTYLKGQVQFQGFQNPAVESFETFLASVSVAF
jgi:hypothetical protein